MKKFTVAALCAGLLAAPLVAKAAELVLVNSAGQPVAVVVPVAEPMAMPMMPTAFPIADIFAQQDAMMRRMVSDMQALQAAAFAAPIGQMNAGPGSTMVISSFSSGRGSCSRTISYEAQPGGATPIVHVQQTGNACGAMPAPNPRATVPVAEPEQEQVAPKPATPGGTRLYQIDYRHKVRTPELHG
jgi:L-aminopeptidase/D-esterase-like protein